MSFTDAQKVAIRKYCGYPAFGSVPVPNFSWRYSTEYGDLEFYMDNLSSAEQDQVTNVYLPNLVLLEQDVPNTRQNSDTSQAAVWYRNKNELKERWDNYTLLRKQLCDFLGCEYGPKLTGVRMARAI